MWKMFVTQQGTAPVNTTIWWQIYPYFRFGMAHKQRSKHWKAEIKGITCLQVSKSLKLNKKNNFDLWLKSFLCERACLGIRRKWSSGRNPYLFLIFDDRALCKEVSYCFLGQNEQGCRGKKYNFLLSDISR